MSEGSDVSPDAGSESSPETATVPVTFCGDTTPTEGYTGTFKVVSIDADNGSMDIVCVQDEKPAARGIKAAVASLK